MEAIHGSGGRVAGTQLVSRDPSLSCISSSHPPCPGWSFMAGSLSLWPLIAWGGGQLGQESWSWEGLGRVDSKVIPLLCLMHTFPLRCSEDKGPARALPLSFSWDCPCYCFPNENSFAGLVPHPYLLHEIQATQEKKSPSRRSLWLTPERR